MKRKEVEKRFLDAGIEDSAHDALSLFRACGYTDAQIFADNPDVTDNDFLDRVKKRTAHVPLAYILGQADFYRETYFVDEHCLIPRMDTELLADYAVHHIPAGAHFADLCTGSGCIAVSVLRHTDRTTADAVDMAENALVIAKKNAEKYGVCTRVSFRKEDVLSFVPKEKYFAVLSNPPYVKDDVYETLSPEVKKEPRMAFVGGADGMDFYRAILQNCKNALLPDGFFAFEIGYDQKDDIENLAKEHHLLCEVFSDLGGRPRLAVLKRPL